MKFYYLLLIGLFISLPTWAQESPSEEDYYKIVTLPVPEGVLLEVGGLCLLPNGTLAVATRRGDIWFIENPNSVSPYFKKYASGLHEILGLEYIDGSLYCTQRGELTKLSDQNGDGIADYYETISAWPISGHYHEYSFGPKIDPKDGKYFVSGNVAFGDVQWWRGEARVPTRGSIFKVSEDGSREIYALGMRSPAGMGIVDGELFYTDNQGDWVGSGGVWHIKKGSFTNHPAGLAWNTPNSPVKLTEEQFFAERNNRDFKDKNGKPIKPENVVDETPDYLYQLKEKYPSVQVPAVWLPHAILGVSNSEILQDNTNGEFSPFPGQLFVGDQGQSKIMRVFLEKINGQYQGAAWDFRSNFQSGVMRMVFANDGSMFVGETNRGWGSAGDQDQGLQRLVWNKKLPFEMETVKAKPDGFEITFTHEVDPTSAENLASYAASSFVYKHNPVYGSPPVNTEQLTIKGVKLSNNNRTVRLVIDGLRKYYVHELNLEGIRAKNTYYSLVHPTVFYTLNEIPDGQKLKLSETSVINTGKKATANSVEKAENVVSPDGPSNAITYDSVKPLLTKNACTACHSPNKKVIGPSFKDIAKRNYSAEQIIKLIYNPEPANWPDFATPMAPMPQVPKAEALKIANYINSLK